MKINCQHVSESLSRTAGPSNQNADELLRLLSQELIRAPEIDELGIVGLGH